MENYGSQQNLPTVSVITPVFNGEKSIQQAIDSISKQKYPNIEHIIVDAESNDQTGDVLQKNQDKISKWIREPDAGIFDGMNKGIRTCSGDIIGILNCDDWYEDGVIEDIAKAFYENPSVSLVHGAMKVFSEDGECVATYGSMEKVSDYLSIPFLHPTCFIKRKAYEIVGYYDTSMKICADHDWMLGFKRKNLESIYIDRIFTNFRLGGASSDKKGLFKERYRVRTKNGCGSLHAIISILAVYSRDKASHALSYLPNSFRRFIRKNILSYHK